MEQIEKKNKPTGQEQVRASFEEWLKIRRSDLKNRPGSEYAAQRSALDQTLHGAELKGIDNWSPEVAREVAGYFFQHHQDVFRDWVRDNHDLALLEERWRVKRVLVCGIKLFEKNKN